MEVSRKPQGGAVVETGYLQLGLREGLPEEVTFELQLADYHTAIGHAWIRHPRTHGCLEGHPWQREQPVQSSKLGINSECSTDRNQSPCVWSVVGKEQVGSQAEALAFIHDADEGPGG